MQKLSYWRERERGTNLVSWESKATTPKMKNMRSIPECSKSFIWEGLRTPLTKNLRWVEYKSSMHMSMKAPIVITYSSRCLSLPSNPGTGFQTLTSNFLGLRTYLTTEPHMCHNPITRNSVPGKAWPLKDPMPLFKFYLSKIQSPQYLSNLAFNDPLAGPN